VAEFDAAARRGLLQLSRAVLEACVHDDFGVPIPDGPPFSLCRGAFVTLRCGAELRGCIGHITADRPLGEVVCRMTVSAALEDPRFAPVAAEDVAQLRIEISVLSEPRPFPERDPVGIQPGDHGVMVRRGWRHGLLLPQVATEQDWSAAELLAGVCRKAGLDADAWRDPETELYVFQVEAFGE